MSSGYSLSIKCLDEASAQIKRINQALKDLEKADNSATDAQTNRLRQTKSLTDKLHAGATEFGKIARSELEKLSKEFTRVSGGIGDTVGELSKVFGIRGLGLGIGVAAAAAHELNKALMETARTSRELGNLSARTGADPQQIQRIQALYKLLGGTAEQAGDSIRNVSTAVREAYKSAGPLGSYLAEHGISIKESQKHPEETLLKVMELASKMPKGQLRTEVAVAFGIPESVFDQLEKFQEKLKEVDERYHTLSNSTLKGFNDLKDATDELRVAWDSLGNTFTDIFGPGPAALLKTFLDELKGILYTTQKFMEMNPGFLEKIEKELLSLNPSGAVGLAIRKALGLSIPDESPADQMGAWLRRMLGMAPPASGGGGSGRGAASNAPGATGAAGKGAVGSGKGSSDVKLSTGKDEAVIRDTIRQAGEKAGLNPEQIRMAQAGFLSNFAYESSLRRDAVGPNGDAGWAQWVGPRKRHMRDAYGSTSSLEANQKQLYYELTGGYKKYLLDAGHAKTPRDAALVAHYFESGGDPRFEGKVKSGHIAQANNFYRNSVVPPASTAPTAPHRSVFPPWTKFNSKGQPYSSDLETMSDKEKANVESSMKAIKNNPHWSDLPKKSKPIMGEEGKNKAAAVDKQAADSHHSVEIAFNNLPQGARVNLHESKGSSSLNVKTSYAMGTV